jgi:hypothetical protein
MSHLDTAYRLGALVAQEKFAAEEQAALEQAQGTPPQEDPSMLAQISQLAQTPEGMGGAAGGVGGAAAAGSAAGLGLRGSSMSPKAKAALIVASVLGGGAAGGVGGAAAGNALAPPPPAPPAPPTPAPEPSAIEKLKGMFGGGTPAAAPPQ